MSRHIVAILAVAFVLTSADARAQLLQPDFVFNFATPKIRVDVVQFVGRSGIVGPDRVETVALIICTSRTMQVRFLTASTAGIPAAEGAALAAILGFMQGRSAADIVKIVGPDVPVSITASNLQLSAGAFESEHVQAVAEQLSTAVGHIALDTPPSLVNPELAAFQAGSGALGVSTGCTSTVPSSTQ